MSLINDLLNDLEERRGGNQDRHEVFNGLSAARERSAPASSILNLVMVAAVIVLVLIVFLVLMPVNKTGNVIASDSKEDALQTEYVAKTEYLVKNDTRSDLPKTPAEPRLRLDQAVNLSVLEHIRRSNSVENVAAKKAVETLIIKHIYTEDIADGVRANIVFSEKPDYSAYALQSPARIVVDIPDADLGQLYDENIASEIVSKIRTGVHDGYIKLVFDMSSPAKLEEHHVESRNGQYVLTLAINKESDSTSISSESVAAENSRYNTEAEADAGKVTVHNQQMEKTPRLNNTITLAEKIYKEASYQYKRGKLGECIDSLSRVLKLEPAHSGARYLLASAYIKQKRVDLALALLDDSVKKLPDDIRIRQLYAQLLYELGRPDKAVAILKKSSPPINVNADYHALLAGILQEEERHAESAGIYRELVKYDSGNSLWWMGLGISEEAQGNIEDAISAYRRALQIGSLAANLRQYVSQRLKSLTREQNT